MTRLVRVSFLAALAVTAFRCAPGGPTTDSEAEVNHVLDELHDAAARADGDRYFALFSPHAIFLGTDPAERWPIEQFETYGRGRFAQGVGWTYRVTERHVYFSDDGRTAWFDEMLFNVEPGTDAPRYGETRGTGVLVRRDDAWKIAQYHLTIPLPNDLTQQVVAMIHAR